LRLRRERRIQKTKNETVGSDPTASRKNSSSECGSVLWREHDPYLILGNKRLRKLIEQH
jgi:hypothetical protein